MKLFKSLTLCVGLLLFAQATRADLMPGLISDFQDGTLQDWTPPTANTTNIPDGGPNGVGDNFLEISPAKSDRIAAFNENVNGTISPNVASIQVDMMRPQGETDLEIRLVLFGPLSVDRWTSTDAQVVVGDGVWRSYTYSVLEPDLTKVLDLGDPNTYADLAANLNRIMFRYNAGAPDPQGTVGGTGTLGLDNVTALAVPEPSSLALILLGGLGCGAVRRGRRGFN